MNKRDTEDPDEVRDKLFEEGYATEDFYPVLIRDLGDALAIFLPTAAFGLVRDRQDNILIFDKTTGNAELLLDSDLGEPFNFSSTQFKEDRYQFITALLEALNEEVQISQKRTKDNDPS